jgi:hypothetical protein
MHFQYHIHWQYRVSYSALLEDVQIEAHAMSHVGTRFCCVVFFYELVPSGPLMTPLYGVFANQLSSANCLFFNGHLFYFLRK